jgi:hypothetical protein
MSGDEKAMHLGRLTDAEAADWILGSDPLEPAIHEVASRIVGILSRRQPGGAGALRDSMDELVRAEVRSTIESALARAGKLADGAGTP